MIKSLNDNNNKKEIIIIYIDKHFIIIIIIYYANIFFRPLYNNVKYINTSKIQSYKKRN